MENYLLAYHFLYCVYLRMASLRDQGFDGFSLLKKGLTYDLAAQGY